MVVRAAAPSTAWAQAEQRPIRDFIDAQLISTYTPWWDPETDKYLIFDAFGTRNLRFGLGLATTFDGKVTVRTQADGRAHVSVLLHTSTALRWGYIGYPAAAHLAFGYGPAAVSVGATPALGHGITRFEFTMSSPDAPLPDYSEDLGSEDYPLELIAAVVSCDGELRALTGYPDGTPVKAHMTQTGRYSTGAPDGCPPEKDLDCFPGEIVSFKPVGPRWRRHDCDCSPAGSASRMPALPAGSPEEVA